MHLYMLREYTVYPSRPCKRYDFHFIHTFLLLFRLMRIMRIVKNASSAISRVRSVAHRFFSDPSTRYPYIEVEEKKRAAYKSTHRRLHDSPERRFSPGICKIIGHYPDPKSRSAGDRLSSTQFECSSVVVICPRYSNRSWGATAVRTAVPCSQLVARTGARTAPKMQTNELKNAVAATPHHAVVNVEARVALPTI